MVRCSFRKKRGVTKFHQIKWAASPEGLLRDRKWRQPAHRVHRVSAAASVSKLIFINYFLLFFFINFIDLILKFYYLLSNDYFERWTIFLEIIYYNYSKRRKRIVMEDLEAFYVFSCHELLLLFFFFD